MLTAVVPCGFEQFIREWSHPVRDPMEPPPQPLQQDIDKLIATAPEYGIELRPEFKAIPDASVPPTDRLFWTFLFKEQRNSAVASLWRDLTRFADTP
jgi:hypothetical protein